MTLSFSPLLVDAIFAVLVLFYVMCAAIISFHFRRYAIPGDRTTIIQRIFFIGNIVFFLLVVSTLISIPWGEFSLPR